MQNTVITIPKLYLEFGLLGPSILETEPYNQVSQKHIKQIIRWHYNYAAIIKENCLSEISAYPDLFKRMEYHKDFIRFQKQLYLHQSNPKYNLIFKHIIAKISEQVYPLFANYYHAYTKNKPLEITWNNIVEQWFKLIETDKLHKLTMLKLSDQLLFELLYFKHNTQTAQV